MNLVLVGVFLADIPVGIFFDCVLDFIGQVKSSFNQIEKDVNAIANSFSNLGNVIQKGKNGNNVLIRKFCKRIIWYIIKDLLEFCLNFQLKRNLQALLVVLLKMLYLHFMILVMVHRCYKKKLHLWNKFYWNFCNFFVMVD